MPVPSTPMRPRPNPGKNCSHQRRCRFPAAWWNSTHSTSSLHLNVTPIQTKRIPFAQCITGVGGAEYGRSIASFQSSYMGVLGFPTRWVARIKNACFLLFLRVLILVFGSIMRRQLPVSSSSRAISNGHPGRHDLRLVTTMYVSREARPHAVRPFYVMYWPEPPAAS